MGAMQDHDHETHRHIHRSGEKLTPARRAVLDLLEHESKPLGAYELMDRMVKPDGRRPAPISVYRALDFLVENGFVHRLASRNAFLACGHSHEAGEPVAFLICDGCGRVAEATSRSLSESVQGVAASAGYARRTQVIEIAGTCADCAHAANA